MTGSKLHPQANAKTIMTTHPKHTCGGATAAPGAALMAAHSWHAHLGQPYGAGARARVDSASSIATVHTAPRATHARPVLAHAGPACTAAGLTRVRRCVRTARTQA
jgi:hypothetical protein